MSHLAVRAGTPLAVLSALFHLTACTTIQSGDEVAGPSREAGRQGARASPVQPVMPTAPVEAAVPSTAGEAFNGRVNNPDRAQPESTPNREPSAVGSSWVQFIDGRQLDLQLDSVPLSVALGEIRAQTGIVFVLDPAVDAGKPITIIGAQLPLANVIDTLLVQAHVARQVLSHNLVVLYPNTLDKQREYQQQMIRNFQLTNMDPNRAADLLRTILNARTIYVDLPSWSIIVRDTPELIEMAQRLLAVVDLPDAEVMMEVEVLEVSADKIRQLGIRHPESVTFTPSPLVGEQLVIADLRYQNSSTWKLSSLAATAEFKESLSSADILASPRIRARNHEKARVLIGQRVPIITNTVTPTNTQPVVTGSVQYVDVGLTLEVEPTVYRDGDVGIRLNLEVSSIIKEVLSTQSGTLAYQMGSRIASTMLRLADGETQVLAGLINDEERRTADRVPTLGGLPLIGRLFGTRKRDHGKTEIVLSITPHIIRPQVRSPEAGIRLWYGTENSLSTLRDDGGARQEPLVPGNQAARGADGEAQRGSYGVPQGVEGITPRGVYGTTPLLPTLMPASPPRD